jgi:hypothetical protein
MLGAVVNDVPRARDRYGDYGGYGSYRTKYDAEQAEAQRPAAGAPAAPAPTRPPAVVPARSFLDLRRK